MSDDLCLDEFRDPGQEPFFADLILLVPRGYKNNRVLGDYKYYCATAIARINPNDNAATIPTTAARDQQLIESEPNKSKSSYRFCRFYGDALLDHPPRIW